MEYPAEAVERKELPSATVVIFSKVDDERLAGTLRQIYAQDFRRRDRDYRQGPPRPNGLRQACRQIRDTSATSSSSRCNQDGNNILRTEWGDSSSRVWSLDKDRYDFTSRWLPRGPFIKSGMVSAANFFSLFFPIYLCLCHV